MFGTRALPAGLVIAFVALAPPYVAHAADIDMLPTSNTKEVPAIGQKGMASSAHPLATQAGLDILAAGGNAFDAAVAIASTLNVVEPQNSGVGGYGIILIYDASKQQVRVLNTSGRIPLAVNADVFRESDPNFRANREGAKAISTPTNLNAWEALSKNYGSLAWGDLFDSAIRAAEEGHVLNASVAGSIRGGFIGFPEYA